MANFIKFIVISAILVSFVGCSSSLTNLNRVSTLDKMDVVDGDTPQSGTISDRQTVLAEKEILNRKIQAEANKGLRVDIVNYTSNFRSYEIRKHQWFGWFVQTNPIIISLLLKPGEKYLYNLMPGKYDVMTFNSNDVCINSEVYEVTSALAWDGNSKTESHCLIGDVKRHNGYSEYYGNGYNRHYRRGPTFELYVRSHR